MRVAIELRHATGHPVVLVEDGKSPYRIMVAVDATMQASYAAQQLQRYVKEMTGAKLPIVYRHCSPSRSGVPTLLRIAK